MEQTTIGTLASIVENKPFSRYMMFQHEDVTLYTATNKHAHKVEDLRTNPDVHILLGYSGEGLSDQYLEIAAKAEVETNQDLKEKYWNDSLKHWIPSAHDPAYLLLKLVPSSILLYEGAGKDPKELSLD